MPNFIKLTSSINIVMIVILFCSFVLVLANSETTLEQLHVVSNSCINKDIRILFTLF